MDVFASNTIPILEQVINFAQSRHTVLAGNVANMDTPGYRVRDLSVNEFQSRLADLIETKKRKVNPTGPYGGPSSEAFHRSNEVDRALSKVEDATKDILYHDDSDVGLEQQILEVSKNQSMHNMAIALLTSQYRLLNVAIAERV